MYFSYEYETLRDLILFSLFTVIFSTFLLWLYYTLQKVKFLYLTRGFSVFIKVDNFMTLRKFSCPQNLIKEF